MIRGLAKGYNKVNLITTKTAGPISIVLFGVLCAAAQGQTNPLVSGNNASFGNGPIATTPFRTGPSVEFTPDGAKIGSNNGRGVLVLDNKVYYTELTDLFGPTDAIRIAPFNGGTGGSDIGGASLSNPRPGCGVQDLAYASGYIYALTGYPSCGSLQVFKIAVGSTTWSAPVTIQGSDATADGFTILVNNGVLTFLSTTAMNPASTENTTAPPARPPDKGSSSRAAGVPE
jgi:hypothetical protein